MHLIDSRTGSTVYKLSGCIKSILNLHFNDPEMIDSSLSSPGGSIWAVPLIMAASSDDSVKLWNTSTGRIQQELTGHVGKVASAKFNPTSLIVASGSHDRTLKVWDLMKGFCTKTVFSYSSCNDLAWADFSGYVKKFLPQIY